MKSKNNSYISLKYLVLLLVIGFPRLPTTDIPIAIFIAPFYLVGFFKFTAQFKEKTYILAAMIFAGIILGAITAALGGTSADFKFSLIIWLKIILSIYFAFVIYKTIEKTCKPLLYWIYTQWLFIVASSVSPDLFNILLYFISPRSAEIFIHIFGLRALGFGLFHLDGSLMLIFASFLYLYLNPDYNKRIRLTTGSFIFALMVARSAVIPYSILFLALFKLKGLLLMVFIFFILGTISSVINIEPLKQAFELFDYIFGGGDKVASIGGLIDMYIFPTNLSTFMFGDGLFFGEGPDLNFYMQTDVGYLRLIYFFGAFGLLIFIFVNLYLFFYALKFRNIKKNTKHFIVSCILIFLISNLKGIQSMPLLAYVFVFFAMRENFNRNIDFSK
jgi:hypothetical protein